MSDLPRRGEDDSLPDEPRTPGRTECVGTDLVMESGPAVADLVSRQKYARAQHYPYDEEPVMSCAFCHRRIEAAEAYHSRYGGQVVCWSCKQAEEA